MAVTYFPFDDGTGAVVDETRWYQMARLWLPSGVALNSALGDMRVFGDSSGRQVKVNPGEAWVEGHMVRSDATEIIAIAANASGNPRIDRLVLRVSRTSNTIAFAVVQGTPAATPAAPALTQTAATYEISLAKVAVANGAATITAGNVTDERPIACGIDGAGGSMVKLAENILAADTAAVTWQNIPQTFASLQIRVRARSTRAVVETELSMRFNNVSGAGYDWQQHYGAGIDSFAHRVSDLSAGRVGVIPGASAPFTSQWGHYVADIMDYSDPTHWKSVSSHGGHSIHDNQPLAWAGHFFNTDGGMGAITRLDLLDSLGGSLRAGSRLSLYGIR